MVKIAAAGSVKAKVAVSRDQAEVKLVRVEDKFALVVPLVAAEQLNRQAAPAVEVFPLRRNTALAGVVVK
jgi:hypothetical protein